MNDKQITHHALLTALVAALEPLDYLLAFWEGGAVGFDRLDEWSDADLQVVVRDEHVEDTFEVVDKTLRSLSEIDLKYRLPEPTWHGHSQCFYRLEEASPFLLVDFVVLKESSDFKEFLLARVHGKPNVLFDKTGLVQETVVEPEKHLEKVRHSLETRKVLFDLFQILTLKELNRGNYIEAISFYQGYTLRPLIEALRVIHCPIRHAYGPRYAHYDLPSDLVSRLQALYFPKDGEDLRVKQKEAETWFWEVVESIDWDEVRKNLE
jgi:hypothetical protein